MRLTLQVVLIVLFIPTGSMSAQTVPPLCDRADGQQIFARQHWQENRVTIVSWTTGADLRDLTISFPFDTFDIAGWSPTCTYLVAQAGQRPDLKQYIWRVDTGDLIGELADHTYKHRFNWSSDEQYLVTQLNGGGYLWHLPTNHQTRLTDYADSVGRSFYSVEFDPVYNQLLVVTTGAGNGVSAFDINSGAQVGFYHIGERSVPVTYRYHDSGRYILVYSTSLENSHDGLSYGLAIWDRNTQGNIQFNPNYERFMLGYRGSGFEIIGSPYSRYFILSDYGTYYGHLYVWDLQNLIGNAPYIPNFQRPQSQRGRIRQLDTNTLDIADWSVWAWTSKPHTMRYSRVDLETMQVVDEITFYPSRCDQPDLLENLAWACHVAYNSSPPPEGINHATYWPHQ